MSANEEFFGDDYVEGEKKKIVEEGDRISPQKKLKFAHGILIGCLSVYVLSMLSNVIWTKEEVYDMWEFTSDLVKTIVLLIIGFYFNSKN